MIDSKSPRSCLRARLAAVPTPVLMLLAAASMTLSVATLAAARELHQVSQKGRAFNMKDLAVATGDTVQFLNDDEFIHQIFIKSRAFTFDSAESEPGQKIDVEFTAAGTYEVRCHIHPKMLLLVTVK